jgi:protease secretion system membrane fusion protein
METDLRFSTFNQRTTPVVQGRVTLVGADKIASDKAVDIQAANPQGDYYIARVELSPDAAEKLLPNVVQPGLPVEVIVKSGERNFISYVMKPLTDSFAKSFLN